jgi:chromosome segregation ATPase
MHNQGIERENDNVRTSIQDNQELRHRQQSTIYQNNGALSKWEQECFAQQTRITVLDKERQTLVQRTTALNEQLMSRTSHAEDVSLKIHSACGDISKLKSMIHSLDLEINEYEKSNSRLVEEQKARLQQNSHQYNKAHELTAVLQNLEAKFYSLEVDERGKNTDLEAVNYSNSALMDRNLDLKQEYEALQKHSVLLTQQNKDLQRELDSFVETDDIVRRNLDRKEKVQEIRTKVDYAIHQSLGDARRNSPRKSPIGGDRTVQFSQQQSYKGSSNQYEGGSRKSYNQNDFSPARG